MLPPEVRDPRLRSSDHDSDLDPSYVGSVLREENAVDEYLDEWIRSLHEYGFRCDTELSDRARAAARNSYEGGAGLERAIAVGLRVLAADLSFA